MPRSNSTSPRISSSPGNWHLAHLQNHASIYMWQDCGKLNLSRQDLAEQYNKHQPAKLCRLTGARSCIRTAPSLLDVYMSKHQRAPPALSDAARARSRVMPPNQPRGCPEGSAPTRAHICASAGFDKTSAVLISAKPSQHCLN